MFRPLGLGVGRTREESLRRSVSQNSALHLKSISSFPTRADHDLA